MIICTIPTSDCTPQTIVIGRRTTYDTLQVVFDLSYLAETYGSGAAVLVVKRSQDTTAYPATITQDGNTLTWTISEVDTYYVGAGECELMWYVNNGLAKTIIYPVVVMRDILQTAEEPPDGYENWVEHLTELGAETQQNALDAAQSATEAETAQGKAEDAQSAAEAAQDAAEEAVEAFTHPTASAETLAPDVPATASYNDGHFTFGIPKGDKGDKMTYADLTKADKLDLIQGPIAEAQADAEQAVEDKGDEVIASIPEDYTALTGEVDDLSNVISDISEIGKNLFDKNNINSFDARLTNNNEGSGIIKSQTGAKTIYIPCLPGTTYTISKVLTRQFSFGYTNVAPEINAEVPYAKTARTSTSITITTGANAQYLVAYVYLDKSDAPESLTFEAVCDTIQIELGETATSYTPFKYTAVDDVARSEGLKAVNDIAEIKENLQTKKVTVTTDTKTATVGDEMITDFSAMTAIGSASYSGGVWDLPVESGISTNLSVTGSTTYLIELGVVSGSVIISDYSTNLRINPLTITLGDASLSIFANGDANWKLCLTPTISGNVTFSVVCEELLALQLSGLSVKPVTGLADMPITVNSVDSYIYRHNIAIGNGQKKQISGDWNTAVGRSAQQNVDTGFANTAVGFSAQNALLNGRANCAIGNNAQSGMTTGMYNNAVGTVAQGNPGGDPSLNLKMIGCWNNAFGNEAQRDLTTGNNNTGMGRRAQSYLTTGCENTAFGSLAGFTQINGHGAHGEYATKTANYQTLIGAESIQAGNGEHDYATAVGYRTYVGTKAVAIGANAEAVGEKAVAIGYGVHADNDHDVVIGDSDSVIVIAGKRITFNQDGTVTWTTVS